jgi:pyruvate,water dikinase
MEESNDLKDRNDVFYLYKNEIFDYIGFHNLPAEFDEIVVHRKKQLEKFAEIKMPRKITTRGMPNTQRKFEDFKFAKSLQGKTTSKGQVTAEVIVMDRLDLSADFRDKILVTTATDPGWTVIFPLLKGVVTEQGGVLSHASIIARELQIPCIVQVPNITSILKTGQKIHMNAVEGVISVLT